MNRPSTAREALVVETIGELAALIDRVEAVAPLIDAARLAFVQVSADLAGQLVAFESRMTAITEHAKVQAVKHIARRIDEMTRSSLDTQKRAMEEASRAFFRTEVGPTLKVSSCRCSKSHRKPTALGSAGWRTRLQLRLRRPSPGRWRPVYGYGERRRGAAPGSGPRGSGARPGSSRSKRRRSSGRIAPTGRRLYPNDAR